MTLMIDAKFEGKLMCVLPKMTEEFGNFHQNTFENLKIGTFIGSFYSKQKMYEPKICRGVMCHDNEE